MEELQTTGARRRAFWVTLVATLAFTLLFIPLEHLIGRNAGPFSLLPVVAAAWFYGVWGGVIAGLLTPILLTLLFMLDGRGGLDVLLYVSGGSATVVLPFIGGFVGWLRDLNARLRRQARQLETQRDQLQTQARELEALSRTKDEFVSLVSHELRTPLTSVTGYVSLLLDGEVGEISRDQREFLEIVKTNADRLVGLINEILDLARIESGRTEIDSESIDLHALLVRVAESFRPQFEAKRQTFILDLPDAAPAVPAVPAVPAGAGPQTSAALDGESLAPTALPRVVGDPARLTQVFVNLLSNACKYTPDGGRITLAARRAENGVRIDVRDTGIGLSAADQERLFEKFFRSPNPAAQEAGGTGLGLAITRELIRLHGGDVTVTSQPRAGSTFTVTLPAELDPNALSMSPEAPDSISDRDAARAINSPGSHPKRILVVDDEPDIAALIRRYLERGGYAVSVAGTAAEAFRSAQLDPPDLMTLDIRLPDADGFTLVEWLRASPQTATIPVIPISIFPDTGRAQSLGIDEYLAKPVDEALLLAKVDRILTTPEELLAAIHRHLAEAL